MPIPKRAFMPLFLMFAAVAGCTVEVQPQRPPGPAQACTFEFAPVCARRGQQERSFDNACLARASGFRILHRGQCRIVDVGPSRPIACTREFAPVCAVRGQRARTFDNACLARAEGFRPVRRGGC
jgi:hypothetical protein